MDFQNCDHVIVKLIMSLKSNNKELKSICLIVISNKPLTTIETLNFRNALQMSTPSPHRLMKKLWDIRRRLRIFFQL